MRLAYCTVGDGSPRKVIHVVQVVGGKPNRARLDEIAKLMRERALATLGDQYPAVVVMQKKGKQDAYVVGEPYAIRRVRAAMSEGPVQWRDIRLD